MERNHRIYALVASVVLAIVMMITIACPAPSPTPTQTAQPTQPSSPTVKPTPTVAPTATPTAAKPTAGGILRAVSQAYPAGYDMHMKPAWGPLIGYPVYSNLVMFDAGPGKNDINPDNIIPDIAKSWETSSDGKVWTFHLQEGVTWHDGKPFTADDVVYNFNKMVNPKRSTVGAGFPTFDRAEATDKYTVRVYLKAATPSFLPQLAGPYNSLMPPQNDTVDWKTPAYCIGTGPFMYKTGTTGISLELVRNPNYYKKDSFGTQLPYFDGIIYTTIENRSAQMDAFITGKVDVTQSSAGIANMELLARVLKDGPQLVVQEYTTKGTGQTYFFNVRSGPLADVKVRRALVSVIDRDELTIAGYGDLAFGDSSGGFFTPAFGLSKDEIYKIAGWDKPLNTRVSEAKKALADAGYASGFEIRLVCRNVPEFVKRLEIIADKWRQLGLNPVIRPMEISALNDVFTKGAFEVAHVSASSFVGDPEEITAYFKGGSPANVSGWSNAEVNSLIEQQSVEMNSAKRRELIRKIETLVWENAIALAEAWSKPRIGNWPYLKNYNSQDAGYAPRWKFEQSWFDKTNQYWANRS